MDYRQKSFARELTPEQQSLKLQKDKEFEEASQALSQPYYFKKHNTGVTATETTKYEAAHNKLWNDYCLMAVAEGLMEELTPEKVLGQREKSLASEIEAVNTARTALGLKPIKIVEV